MNKLIVIASSAVVLGVGAYLAGVGITAYKTSDVIADQLNGINEQLKTIDGDLKFKLVYQQQESGLFSQSGDLILQADNGNTISLPTEISHGFLKVNGTSDLQPLLDALYENGAPFAKHGKNYMNFEAGVLAGEVAVDGVLDAVYDESYAQNCDTQGKQLLTGEFKGKYKDGHSSKVELTLHNIISDSLLIKNTKIEAESKFDSKGEYQNGSLTLKASDIKQPWQNDFNLDEGEFSVSTDKPDKERNTDLHYAFKVQGSEGKLKTKGKLGKLSLEKLIAAHESGQNLSLISEVCAEDLLTVTIESMDFSVHSKMTGDDIRFKGNCQGSASGNPNNDTLLTLNKNLNGHLEINLSDLNENAEMLLFNLGNRFYVKNGESYSSILDVEHGKLTINGKRLF